MIGRSVLCLGVEALGSRGGRERTCVNMSFQTLLAGCGRCCFVFPCCVVSCGVLLLGCGILVSPCWCCGLSSLVVSTLVASCVVGPLLLASCRLSWAALYLSWLVGSCGVSLL